MRLRSKLFYSYVLFLALYSAFILLPAPSPVMLLRYRVSSTGIRLVYITIILIVAAIWYAGFYSYAKLHQYVESIKGDKDGKQIDKLSKGIFLLIMWLPLSSVISAILQYVVTKHPGALAAVTIIDNYINLLLPLGGFILIGMGARGLSELTRRRTTYRAANLLAVVLVYIGIIYYRLVASTPDRTAIYHMTIWFIALTLIAPYIYMWFTGLLATYEIYSYQKKVVGVVYRKSLRFLVLGLGWLIVTSISFQYLTSLSARLSRLSIYWLLVIIYSLLLVLSVGFVLIAIGTRKLQKIEEA